MDWQALQAIATSLAILGSAGAWIYAYLASRHRATDDDIRSLAARVNQIEATLQDLPRQKDLAEIIRQIEQVGGDVRALASSIGGVKELLPSVQNSVTLVTEHLLKGNR